VLHGALALGMTSCVAEAEDADAWSDSEEAEEDDVDQLAAEIDESELPPIGSDPHCPGSTTAIRVCLANWECYYASFGVQGTTQSGVTLEGYVGHIVSGSSDPMMCAYGSSTQGTPVIPCTHAAVKCGPVCWDIPAGH
jgi:hypothetical protein